MQLLDCLALQKESKELVIHCLDKNSNVKQQIVIPTGHVKQLLSLADDDDNGTLLALLGHNTVEFWQWNGSSEFQQRLQLMQAEQIALAKHENQLYLAVLTAPPATGVHIYRSDYRKSLDFQIEQVFDLDEAVQQPRHLSFVQLHRSKDLLLCLSNATPTQPLRIYQYQGVKGFQQILGDSTLPGAKLLKTLQMPGMRHPLLALADGDGVYLVAPQFTRL
ncbi:hypothetical protein ACLKA6_017791 [Drosophila palustris]